MTFENVGDSVGREIVSKVRHSTSDTAVTPVSIFTSQSDDKSFDLVLGSRPSWFPVSTAIVLVGDELSMPCEQGLGRHDIHDLGQRTSAQLFRPDGKPAPLIIGEPKSSVTDLFTKDAIFLGEIFDSELLMLTEPARKACNQK